jgi:hypothetical protein
MATRFLRVGSHGEKLADLGFWLHGNRVEGNYFDAPTTAPGFWRMSHWASLGVGTLRVTPGANNAAVAGNFALWTCGPILDLVDAVTDRAMAGPTELSADELETLLPTPPDPSLLRVAQRMLQEVGITWPGSPEIPPEPPPDPDRWLTPPTMVFRTHPLDFIGSLGFNRDTIVRAALRAYVEGILARLDPLERHRFPICAAPKWTGDLQRGAFYNGDGRGNYDVVAWTEEGVVGLTYEVGFGPLEQLGLSAAAVTGGPDDVRAALPELPVELSPALAMAAGLLDVGPHGEKLAGVGFWLHGHRVAGTLFDTPKAAGVPDLALWGRLPLDLPQVRSYRAKDATFGRRFAEIDKLVEAVVTRAFRGPTELTTDELATLLPTPPAPERLLGARRMLQKVGISWPGSPEIPGAPTVTGPG